MGMTEAATHRLSLLLAIIGATLMVANTLSDVWLPRLSKNNLPAFEKSHPELRDWPRHTWPYEG
jgi:hypothetical protein